MSGSLSLCERGSLAGPCTTWARGATWMLCCLWFRATSMSQPPLVNKSSSCIPDTLMDPGILCQLVNGHTNLGGWVDSLTAALATLKLSRAEAVFDCGVRQLVLHFDRNVGSWIVLLKEPLAWMCGYGRCVHLEALRSQSSQSREGCLRQGNLCAIISLTPWTSSELTIVLCNVLATFCEVWLRSAKSSLIYWMNHVLTFVSGPWWSDTLRDPYSFVHI